MDNKNPWPSDVVKSYCFQMILLVPSARLHVYANFEVIMQRHQPMYLSGEIPQ